MAEKGFKRKLTAILSADAVEYSRLMGDDEESTVRTLTAYREVLSTLIQQHNGKVLDSPGDNLMAEFVSVVDAVQCAVAVQKEIKLRNDELPVDRRMQFRIGINLGDVIQEEGRIYGDGVNIAARLEGLAEPGGICLSKTAFDHIESKLPYGYEFLGDQTVKNIAKPVGAYKVLMEPRVTVAGKHEIRKVTAQRSYFYFGVAAVIALAVVVGIWQFYSRRSIVEPASVEKMAYPLPDKPSIAVLPFTNMSGDPELEYFCDGFTDTLIAAFSSLPHFFVISRNSVFTYKGKAVKVKQVAEELSVRYVIEGSVQKSDDRIRIIVQLIDAIEGEHQSWRFDRNFEDTLKLQDEMIIKILTTIAPRGKDIARLEFTPPFTTDNLDAILIYLNGNYVWNQQRTPDSVIKTKSYCEEAIKLDSDFSAPYILLSYIHRSLARWGISKTPEKSLEQALILARKAVEIRRDSNSQAQLCQVYYDLKEYEKAISACNQALELNAENDNALMNRGFTLVYSGQPKEAVIDFKNVLRVNPRIPEFGLMGIGLANFFMGDYEEAVSNYNKALTTRKYWRFHLDLIACYVKMGNKEEAKKQAEQVLKINEKFSLNKYLKMLPIKNPEYAKPYTEALQSVGLPE